MLEEEASLLKSFLESWVQAVADEHCENCSGSTENVFLLLVAV